MLSRMSVTEALTTWKRHSRTFEMAMTPQSSFAKRAFGNFRMLFRKIWLSFTKEHIATWETHTMLKTWCRMPSCLCLQTLGSVQRDGENHDLAHFHRSEERRVG